MALEEDEFALQRKLRFTDFLDANSELGYDKKVEEMLREGQGRLVVSLNDIRNYDSAEAKNLLDRPMECIPAYEKALKEMCDNMARGHKNIKVLEKYHVAIEGSFGSHRMGPREMMSDNLTQLVCVEGIVTKCSLVRPKVVRTVHYCEATGKFQANHYRDATSFEGAPTGSTYLTTDDQGNKLTTEFGLSVYKNHQKVFIQDMPERTAAGSMPRTLEVIVEDDLVDRCKPGDRVQMIGVYRALSGRAAGESTARFKTVVIANNVRRIGRDEHKRDITGEDLLNFKKTMKKHKRDMFDVLARSVAPTIYGHEYIKKAVVLMLLGGCEKNLDNGTHIRGDINILMVGDPSTAKSQLLRAVMQTGKLVINTTGRGSSGVGLTAAVTTDKDSGERRLEAGAMVLADRGIVCIDEFDKMSDDDRTAIHEVMEQQTVTIAKAGIHASLNARCSVIAASNPVYGQYVRDKKPSENIALPDSLLSRFDLLFIVLDKLDPKIDRAISEHVLRMHRYTGKETDDHGDSDEDEDETGATEVYEKRDKLLQGAAASLRKGQKKVKFFTSDFVKKFIEFAKTKALQNPPTLTDEAREAIAQAYAELRGDDSVQTLPITARCLETMIRLSSAHAKMRVSSEITVEDVEAVSKVLSFALTHDAAPTDGTEPEHHEREEFANDEEEMDDEMVDDEDEDGSPVKRKRSKRKKPDGHFSPERVVASKSSSKSKPQRADRGKDAQLAKFIVAHWRETRKGDMGVAELVKLVLSSADMQFNSEREIMDSLQTMANNDKLFINGDKIYRI